MHFHQVLGAIAMLQLICTCNGYSTKKPKPLEMLGQTRMNEKMGLAKMDAHSAKPRRKPVIADKRKVDLARIEADLLMQEIIAQSRKNLLNGMKDLDVKSAKERALKNRKSKVLQNFTQKQDDQTGLAQTHAHAAWPEGTYAFPEPIEGCPREFRSGCRYQDNEDWDNLNDFRNDDKLYGLFSDNIEICYCVRTTSVSSGRTTWPAGRYCINRYGGSCPSNFMEGELYFDDEDDGNQNTADSILPDGTFDSDTRLQYCCRSDGSVSTAITLPTSNSFILYQYIGQECQAVHGMTAVEVKVKFDNEDYRNEDECTGGPFNPLCDSENHEIYMCHYS